MSTLKSVFGTIIVGSIVALSGPGGSTANEGAAFNRLISDLSEDWWQWAYSIPDNVHPLNTNGLVDGIPDEDALALTPPVMRSGATR